MIDPAEALGILLEAATPLGDETVGLERAAGRVLAERVVADRDHPASDRSAMDGFALRSADVKAPGAMLQVIGEIPAGRAADGVTVGPGQAVRIFTGAPVPRGADAVVMVEMTTEEKGRGTVRIDGSASSGQNIRRRGEDRRAGDAVLEPPSVIGPPEIAVLATVGCTEVRVRRVPRAMVLSTGDEIVAPKVAPAEHQVRNSNAPMLRAQLDTLGVHSTDLGIVRDVTGGLDAGIARGGEADVLLLSGGVSVGEYDLVAGAVRRAEYQVLFHNVAMRPGKPLLAARRDGRFLFGLPGNPLSAFTAFQVFVAPVLRRMIGHPAPVIPAIRARLIEPLHVRTGRWAYTLARLDWRDGCPIVTPVRSASSGDVLSLPRANAFIRVPPDVTTRPAGADVEVIPWTA